MLFSEENVKANIRNRSGKRVFYLSDADTLTPSARDWLRRERIEILPASQARPEAYHLENGALFPEKPEHYTHLQGDVLVPKTHPRIAFRGAMDSLQAQLLLTQAAVAAPMQKDVGEILTLARNILRWDVLEEPAKMDNLCGLSPDEIRSHSHRPQDFYGVAHFMPAYTDGNAILQLNLARTAARSAELAAAHAFTAPDGTCTRTDLLQALNRMSSMLYILMLQLKKER